MIPLTYEISPLPRVAEVKWATPITLNSLPHKTAKR